MHRPVTIFIVLTSVAILLDRAPAARAARPATRPVVTLGGAEPAVVSLDLGTIYSGEGGEGEFVIRNATHAAIMLRPKVACGCTTVKVEQPSLLPDEVTNVVVHYNSAERLGTAGAVSKQFWLVEEDGAVARLAGSFGVTVRPSISFDPPALVWRCAPTDDRLERRIAMRNATRFPVTVRWAPQPGIDVGYAVEPSEVKINGGADAEVLLKLDPIPLDQRRPVIGSIPFSGTARLGERGVELKFDLPATITPPLSVTAIPGSFVLGTSDFKDGRVARTLKLRQDPGSDVHVVGVRATDPRVVVTDKGAAGYLVEVKQTAGGDAIMDSVRVEYVVGDRHGTLEVPVYASAVP